MNITIVNPRNGDTIKPSMTSHNFKQTASSQNALFVKITACHSVLRAKDIPGLAV